MNNVLKNFSETIKQDFEGEKQALLVLLVLLSIPFPYIVNSIAIAVLGLYTLIRLKTAQIRFQSYLLFPILLYVLMALSFWWSIDRSLTLPALSKELSLLLIPLFFWLFGGISQEKKATVLKYYSHCILIFALFYLAQDSFMKKILFSICLAFGFFSCSKAQKTEFSKEALSEKLLAADDSQVAFKNILKKYKGKTLLIEVWASWCGDCVKAMPQLKELQANNPTVSYLFLSAD